MNLLAVSLAYPPLAYPRSIQVARLLKHTDATTVIFCADEPGVRLDKTIEPDAEAKLRGCIRVPVIQGRMSSLVDRFLFRFAPGAWSRRNLVPDRYGDWKEQVVNAIPRYIREDDFQPDVIVTFAQPFTDHLIGLELRSRLDLPWLAHFSDPWVDNPFTPFDDRARRLNLELERSVAEKADMLVFTSQETLDLFCSKYPPDLKEKARVLTQCFDTVQYEQRPRQASRPIMIRYLGNFYGHRRPEPLIAGLKELYRKRPECLENVSIELIGQGSSDDLTNLVASLPKGLLTARSSVDYRESLDLMVDSDGLLIIDAPADLSVFLPSKLIDYIGADRPVLGITPEGTAASLIRELGGLVANPADIPQISNTLELFIEQLWGRRTGKTSDVHGTRSIRAGFSVEHVSSRFRSMLDLLKSEH